MCATSTALAQTPAPSARGMSVANTPRTGDFDQMLERRLIRVAVPVSRTLYFNDKGRERGITADTVRDFERYVNQKYVKQLGRRPITVVMLPTTRDKLLPDLAAGICDIAAGNITVTDARLQAADFVAPADVRTVRELLITGPRSPDVRTIDDLAGKTIHVRRASSYFESMLALNERLQQDGKPAVNLVALPDALEDEDILEMVNAGVLPFAVVDDWKAQAWAQVLPKIAVRTDIVLRDGGRIGWAIRKDSPRLTAELEGFYRDFLRKQGVVAYRFKQYHQRVKVMRNNTDATDLKRFEDTVALFRKYGAQYRFDPIMLAAQGYQESQLDQRARSHVGAIGVMQIMPATGKELKVGDIGQIEPNIHGGAKYLDQLMTRYFPDARFDDSERPLFAFASYNAGPGNIAKMRKEAMMRGLDPDRWFNNVELVTAEKIGIETTTYVRNIFKYYTAYKLLQQTQAAAAAAREHVTGTK
ncbi:MAG TPA: transglycosylase SLT domain-containing protein [Casimicrobiaceae bacterium]|nr:transglycosylase SLT domain-containing protein [Casimicrobiaceae bacterium]